MSKMSAMPVLRPQIFRSLLHSGWPLLRGVLQVGLLSALWVAMEAVRAHFGWGMPAGLIGFALLATGLFSGLVKARWLQAAPTGCWPRCCCSSCPPCWWSPSTPA
jgi:holin-like protein